jgi:predicted nucleic acid-binding protein
MAGIIFDTSVYISAIRSGDAGILDLRRASRMGAENSEPLWLSAVVLSELLTGLHAAVCWKWKKSLFE